MNKNEQLKKLLARIEELGAIETRTEEQTAEYDAALDQAETLGAEIKQEAANRKQAEEAETARQSRAEALRIYTQEPANLRGAFAGVNNQSGNVATIARQETNEQAEVRQAIESDFGALGLNDRQIRHTMSGEYREAWRAWMRSNDRNLPQTRALNESNFGDGGVLVPPDVVAEVIQRKQSPQAITSRVRRITTTRDEVNFPKFLGGSSTQSNGLAVQWLNENGSAAEDTNLENFGNVRISIHRGSIIIVASRSLLEDSAFNLESWAVGEIVKMKLASDANMIINGSGVGRPRGILQRLTGAQAISTRNIGNTPTYAGLLGLVGDLQDVYAENATWVWQRLNLYSNILSLRDTNGLPLFGTTNTSAGGATARVDGQMLGYPVIQTDFMPAAGSANNVTIFGDLSEYLIAERVALQMERYIDPALQKADQVGWYVRFRMGGDVLQENAFRVGVQS